MGGADQLDRRILGSAVHPALERNGYNRSADTPGLRLIGISSPVENNAALVARPSFAEAPYSGWRAIAPSPSTTTSFFRYAALPDDSGASLLDFSPEAMRAVFEMGRRCARDGNAWR